ncbi:MAG: ATP-dependent helicase [Alkalispirochaetaceae bacterium]
MQRELQQAITSLNPQQREAVLHQDTPLLILAGAGSGKTRVITVKIAYLIEQLGADPRSILAVTFTNKAAGEMRERAGLLAPQAHSSMIRTFHSFGAWMLRRNTHLLDMPSGFTIYDDDDMVTLLRSIFPDYNRNVLKGLAHRISRAKDYGLAPEDDLSIISHDPEFRRFYAAYEKRLREIGNADFGDLILRPVELLRESEEVRRRMQDRFRYILVDEYQDSNTAQFQLLQLLAGPESFVCVVGDDDQSIYRFRGAEVRNILTFPESFPNTKVVRLEENYRSTAPILDVASAVVARNEGRLGKRLFTRRQGGATPKLLLLNDHDEEVEFVLDRVRRAEREGRPGEIAVLYRTNAQSRLFETALLRENISYKIIGTLRFYEREEVKDAIAFLKFFANPKDEVSFRRIVNKPSRGIGGASIDRVLARAAHSGGDLKKAAEYALPDLSARARKSLRSFLTRVEELSAALEGKDLSHFVERVITDSGLKAYHQEQDEVSGSQKLQNLEELVNASSLYEANSGGLIEFLEAVELDSRREQGEDPDARVILITMHNTKGLEFNEVIITGLEDGLFPRNGEDLEEVEEERRLFYVACTRAREELYLTTCRYRRLHGRLMDFLPSRFLSEIPEEALEREDRGYGRSSWNPAGLPFGRTTSGEAWGAPKGSRGGSAAKAGAIPPEEDLPELDVGTAVFHDEYGRGYITKKWYNGRDVIVLVHFESGMNGQFLPKYTPLDRVAGD